MTLVQKLLIALAAAVVIVCGVYSSPTLWAKDVSTQSASVYGKEEAFWVSRIQAVGAEAAYVELAREVQQVDAHEQHSVAHIFGGALYRAVGSQGISVCDSRFYYGCFHEFMGHAIVERGVSVIKDIAAQCAALMGERGEACRHGIGHGILLTLGYTVDDLLKSLDLCSQLPQQESIGGCYSGVFMEYNLPEGENPRPLVGGDYFAPCDALSDYQDACVFSAPRWWVQLFKKQGQERADAFTHAADVCKQNFLVSKEICYKGLGNAAFISAGFDAIKAKSLCAVIQDAHMREVCNIAATRSAENAGTSE
jgi:hypothetical protein